jgi:hypothetical protein
MNKDQITPSTLKVTAKQDVDISKDLEKIQEKSVSSLLEESENEKKETPDR